MKEEFPRLFSTAIDKKKKVMDLESWKEGVWEWRWNLHRELFVWELEIVQEMHKLLQSVIIQKGVEDSWCWRWEKNGHYSMKSALNKLYCESRTNVTGCFKQVWNSSVPLKVSALAFRMVIDRLATRNNLAERGVIKETKEIKCLLRSKKEEIISSNQIKRILQLKIFEAQIKHNLFTW